MKNFEVVGYFKYANISDTIQANSQNEVVLAEDENGKIIGAVSILIRKIPIFGNIMYSSRGPTCDIHDFSVMKQLTDGIRELAKKYNAFVYKAEPDIESKDEEFRKVVTRFLLLQGIGMREV